jgi:N-[(2S)-2-amino-2-carboxyethyl]-L-glutamate dehydrogenase
VIEPELRVLDRAMVERCVASFDPLELVESVLRSHASGNTVLPAEAYMEWSNQAGAYCRSIAMPGGVPGSDGAVYGVKIINAAVSNPAIGLARAGGVAMLFDPETARPCLLADAAYLSALRTAAYTLVSLRYLGPSSCESVSMLGCGALAREHIRLLARYNPDLSRVFAYDLDPSRADALAAWVLRRVPGVTVVRSPTASQAVAASNVLITVTTSRKPYIEKDWFRPASFVAHVSLDDVAEDAFLEAEAIFVDDVALVRDNPRRILGRLMAEGKIAAPSPTAAPSAAPSAAPAAAVAAAAAEGGKIAGTLGEVLTGRRQAIRPSGGVVVSNPFGMSILDIGLLARVAAAANALTIGHSLRVFGAEELCLPKNAGSSPVGIGNGRPGNITGESIQDTGRALGCMLDLLVTRTDAPVERRHRLALQSLPHWYGPGQTVGRGRQAASEDRGLGPGVLSKQRPGLDIRTLPHGLLDDRGFEQGQHAVVLVRDELVHGGREFTGPALVARHQGSRLREGRFAGGHPAHEFHERLQFPAGVPGDLLGSPEVRVLIHVHVVERDEELVEHAVLPAVSPLELQERGLLVDLCGQDAVDGPCGEKRAVRGQVHARGEYGVDEACRVADENHTRPPELGIQIRIVLAHAELSVLALRDQLRVPQVFADHRAFRYERQQCLFRIPLDLLGHFPSHDRADACQCLAQRNVPEPAAVEGRG